jgi:hypothetical protein
MNATRRRRAFFLGFDVSPSPNLDPPQRNSFARSRHGVFGHFDQSKAAGNFHKKNRHTLDRIDFENPGQFLPVGLDIIQLRTSHYDSFSFQKITMKVGISKGDAIRDDEQVRVLKVRGSDRNKFPLNGPLGKHGRGSGRPCDISFFKGPQLDRPGSGARCELRGRLDSRLIPIALAEMSFYLMLVKLFGLSFNDLYGIFGTVSETGAQAVAESVAHQPGLPLNDPESTFSTVGNAESAAGTSVLVDPNNLSGSHDFSLNAIVIRVCL